MSNGGVYPERSFVLQGEVRHLVADVVGFYFCAQVESGFKNIEKMKPTAGGVDGCSRLPSPLCFLSLEKPHTR